MTGPEPPVHPIVLDSPVLWCATGHDDEEDRAERWPVATYWPSWYADASIIAR